MRAGQVGEFGRVKEGFSAWLCLLEWDERLGRVRGEEQRKTHAIGEKVGVGDDETSQSRPTDPLNHTTMTSRASTRRFDPLLSKGQSSDTLLKKLKAFHLELKEADPDDDKLDLENPKGKVFMYKDELVDRSILFHKEFVPTFLSPHNHLCWTVERRRIRSGVFCSRSRLIKPHFISQHCSVLA